MQACSRRDKPARVALTCVALAAAVLTISVLPASARVYTLDECIGIALESNTTLAGAREDLFTPKAYELAHDLSGGIPRRINNICNLALLLGASRQLNEVDEMVIYDVSRTLEGEY